MKYAPIITAVLSLLLGGLSAYAADNSVITVMEYKLILITLVPVLLIQTAITYFKEFK